MTALGRAAERTKCPVISKPSVDWKSTNMATIEEDAMAMFGAADKDKNNTLSHTELKKYMRQERWARTLLTGDDFHWMVWLEIRDIWVLT